MKSSRQITLFCLIRFLIYFAHWMVLAHLPLILKENQFTDVEIGITISLYSLSSMFLMLPLGTFSDFFSPKRLILLGAAVLALSYTMLAQVSTFWPVIFAVLLAGIGTAALIVITESLFLKLFAQQKRGSRIALFQLCTYLGFGLGPLVGGLLLPQAESYLFFTAALTCGVILSMAIFLEDYPALDISFKQYSQDLKQPKALLLIACIFVLGTHFGVEQTSFSLLLTEDLHFSVQTIGIIFTCIGIWMAIVVPFIGRLHDKKESVFLFLLVGMAISGFFQMLTPFASNLTELLGARLLHTFGDTIAILELSVLVAVVFPASRLGGNSGVMYAARTTATFLAALMAGLSNRWFGYAASFFSNGIFVLIFVGAVLFFIIVSQKRRTALGWTKLP